jgi:hypothetical protein
VPDLQLRAYGRMVALAGPAEALEIARNRLPPSYRIATGPVERRWEIPVHPAWEIDSEGNSKSVPPDIAFSTESVLSDLELWVAEHARRYVFVHAGCVVIDGKAIVLPGRSMSGKSSLTAALIRAGAHYYSDEYAVLDRRGVVRPYPRKLSLRPYRGGNSSRVSVEELGGKSGRGPAQVALVADLRFDGNLGWQTKGLTRGQAMIRLFDNTVAARSRPEASLSALEAATLGIQTLSGTRGDADESAELLLNMLLG